MPKKGDRRNPPKWDEKRIDEVIESAEHKDELRQKIDLRLMLVEIDNLEVREIDFNSAEPICLSISESAGAVEIKDKATGFLLVYHVLAEWNTSEDESHWFVWEFANGKKIKLRVTYMDHEEELGEYEVEILCSQVPS